MEYFLSHSVVQRGQQKLSRRYIIDSGVFRCGGGTIVRLPPPLSSDREFLDNFCTVFVSLFRDWTVKFVSQGIYSITIRVFCLLKTASKCTQTFHFGDKNDFFSGEGAQPPPLHPTPSTHMAPRPLLTEILNTPLIIDVHLNFTHRGIAQRDHNI